jgi:prolipoprotein diacylglyceryltransferase
LLNFLILYKILQHKKANKTKSGIITGIYMINYGIIRIVVERFRIDTSTIIGPLKANDIFSVLLVLSGIIILNYSRIKHGFTRKEKQSN